MASPRRLAANENNISVRKKREKADERRYCMRAIRAKQSAEANVRESCGATGRVARSLVIVSEYEDDIDADDEDHHDSHDAGGVGGGSAGVEGDGDESSLGSFVDGDDARHNNDVEDSTSLTDAEDVPASDNTSCSSSPPEEESQLSQREREEAAACNAFSGAGCVMGTEIALSDDDEDDTASLFDDGEFVDGEEAIRAMLDEDIARQRNQNVDDTSISPPSAPEEKVVGKIEAKEAAAHTSFGSTGCVPDVKVVSSDDDHDDNDDIATGLVEEVDAINALPVHGNEKALSSPDSSFRPPPPQDKATGKNAAEAAARNAFAGAGCVSGQDVVFSDDRSDGDGYDDGTFVDGVEAINALLDQGDADGLDRDSERVLGVDAASVLVSIDGSSGLASPPLVKQVPQVNDTEPKNSTALETSAGTGSASTASSSRTSDEGFHSRSFQPSSAVPPKPSSPLDDTLPMTQAALLSPPLTPPPPLTAPQRFDLSATGDDGVKPETPHISTGRSSASPSSPSPPSVVQRAIAASPQPAIRGSRDAIADLSSAPALHYDTTSPSSPSLPPQRPLLPVDQSLTAPLLPPAVPGARSGVEAGRLHVFEDLPSVSAVHQDKPPSPSPLSPTPPPVTQAPPSLPLPAPVPFQAPVSPPSASSFNPLKGMFSPELDTPGFASSLGDVLYRGGVLPVSAKSRQALKAVGKGQATSDVMEAIIRGMGSAHGKTNLARDNAGAKFVGPKTRTPTYKTAKGLSRLLSEISKRHETGTNFVVCLDSPGPNKKAHVITGAVSQIETPTFTETEVASAWGLPLPLSSTEALIHGDGGEMTVNQWIEVNGDIEDGQRLSAWVY